MATFRPPVVLVARANRRAIERAREPKARDRAKSLEERGVGDALALMQQLGANPSAATASSRDTTPGTDSDLQWKPRPLCIWNAVNVPSN